MGCGEGMGPLTDICNTIGGGGGTGSLVCQLLPLCCYYLLHNPSQLCNDGNAGHSQEYSG